MDLIANKFDYDTFISFTVPLQISSTVSIVFVFIIWWYWQKKNYSKYNTAGKKIKLEDPLFGRKFTVYSEDDIEARYLVTPAFMERFLKLTTSFGTKNAKCAFFDNKVMFAISTRRDLFEFGSLFKSLENPNNIGFFNEIFSIFDMIDYFKLDEYTGL